MNRKVAKHAKLIRKEKKSIIKYKNYIFPVFN
jgi:hypothetical protein